MIEKESLTHRIEDDMERRNRNWDIIKAHLRNYTEQVGNPANLTTVSKEVVGAVNELKDEIDTNKEELTQHKQDYTEQRQQDQLKVAKVEKDINDYRDTIRQINVNQEPKQKVSGYGILSLPRNTANGQISASLKGETRTNLIKGGNNDLDAWNGSYKAIENGYYKAIAGLERVSSFGQNILNAGGGKTYTLSLVGKSTGTTGNNSMAVRLYNTDNSLGALYTISFTNTPNDTRKSVKIPTLATTSRMVVFPYTTGSDGILYFKDVLLEEGEEVKNYISGGTKSTVSAIRLKSVGKNLLRNGNGENGTIYWNPLTPDSFIFSGEYFEKVAGVGVVIYSEYFKLPAGQFRLSSIGQSLIGPSFQVDLLDENKVSLERYYHSSNLTSAGVTINLTESKNVRIRLITGDTSNHFIIKQIQLEKGTIATEYEPYKESVAYITAKDESGNILELRSLPNGTKDEISLSEKKAIIKIGTKTDVVSGTVINYTDMADGGQFVAYYEDGTQQVGIKGDTLTAIATTLTYQLAEPEIIPVEVSGNIVAHPNGTIYIEPVVADANVYNDGIIIFEQELNIDYIDKIAKVDYVTGVETPLDISKAVISEDKKSFTHPDLMNGDMVFFSYFYSDESTEGETTVEYYDSRYTIKDKTIPDKFYQWDIEVDNGVPSIKLVEV